MTKTRTQSKNAPLIPVAAPVKVFDISTRRMASTIDVAIMDPLDITVDTGMRVVLRSPQSPEMREASAAWYAEHAPDGKLDKGQWSAFMLAMAIAGTASWSGLADGETPIEPTRENIATLYTNLETAWVGEQAAAAYFEKSRFFARPRSS